MVAPAIIAAGIGALGSLGGAFMSAGGAAAQNAAARDRMNQEMQMWQRENDLNQWYFQKNWENQMYMSNTAYQRAMGDMREAGLNPILAYQQGGAGGGSGSQSAAHASLSDPMPQNPAGEMGRGLGAMASSALDAAQTISNIENTQANNDLIKEQVAKTTQDTKLSSANTVKALTDAGYTEEQIKNMPFYRDLLKAQTGAAGGATAASYAAAGLSGAQADQVRQDEERKRHGGTGAIGTNISDAERIIRRIYNAMGGANRGSSQFPVPNPADPRSPDPANPGRDRLNRPLRR